MIDFEMMRSVFNNFKNNDYLNENRLNSDRKINRRGHNKCVICYDILCFVSSHSQ